jgi:tape measure domain-containing protein
MSVRQDKVQISVEFITDESKQLAKTILDTKQLGKNLNDAQKELEKYRQEVQKAGEDEVKRAAALEKVAAAEKKVELAAKQVASAGKDIEKLDLSKVAPAQLIERAKQLQQALRFAPANTEEAANYRQELQRVNTQLATLNRQTRATDNPDGPSGFFGKITSLAGKGAALVGGLAVAFEGLKKGISGASDLEQLTISFETFLGSADRAKKVIADLKAFEVKTPFEAEQVNTAGRALLAFGFSTDELIPTLTRLGDVAAGTGKDFNELALIYGKARTQGLVQGEELNQLAEAGIPIYKELSKVLKVNEEDIRKLGEQGKIQFSDLEQVFKNMTGEGGKFSGLMERQSKSLGGLWSTLQSAFEAFLTSVGTALLPALKEILTALTSLVNFVGPVLTPVFDVIGKSIHGLTLLVTDFFDLFSAQNLRNFGNFITESLGFYDVAAARKRQLDEEELKRQKELEKEYEIRGRAEEERDDRQISAAARKKAAEEARAASAEKAEKAAERAKKAFDAALAAETAQLKREELLLENRRIKGQIDEEQYWVDLNTTTEEGLKRKLEIYKIFHKLDTAEAQEVQNQLDKLTITREEFRAERSVQILQEAIDSEQELRLRRVELQDASNKEELQFIEAFAAKVNEQDKKNKKELLENEKKLAEERQKIKQEEFKATSDLFGLTADLLARDAETKKKNASVIKAFQKAQITVDSIAEIQGIYKNAQTSISAGITGPAVAYTLATIQAAVAAGRAALAINNIEQAKFARGVALTFGRGKAGIFGGNSHATGGTKGWFSDGTQVEVEKDEAWAVVNKKNTPLLRYLSGINALNGNGNPYFRNGGVLKFESGGLPQFNTTPTSTAPIGGIQFSGGTDSGTLERAAAIFYAAVQMMPTEVQAKVSYLEIESAGDTLNTIRENASI